MAQAAPMLGWSLRHLGDEVRFGDFLLHLFAWARDPARGLLAAHHAKSRRTEGDARGAFLDERRYRLAELSIVGTLGGGRHRSAPVTARRGGRPWRQSVGLTPQFAHRQRDGALASGRCARRCWWR